MHWMARLFAVTLVACPASAALAADGTEVKEAKTDAKNVEPLMTKRGKQLLSEDFAGGDLPAAWRAAKGKWSVVDGALKGVELASDMHPAAIRMELKHADAIYQFDFKFDGGKTAALSLNADKGHVCRVRIQPTGFVVAKDGSKTDEADKATPLDSCKMTFEPGKWYTMVVETSGPEILARVDDKHYAFGQDAKVATPKANFGFPCSGDATYFDNVKVWEATPNPEWAATKAKLSSEHPEKLTPGRPGAAGKAKAKADAAK